MGKTLFRCCNQCFDDLHDGFICSFEYPGHEPEDDYGDDCKFVLTPRFTVQCLCDEDSKRTLNGDFVVVLQDIPFGPCIRIPVKNGQLVEDRSQWQHDDPVLDAEIVKFVESGAIVRLGDVHGFLPNSLMLTIAGGNEWQVGQTFSCEVIRNDGEHPVVVKPIAAT